MLHIVVGPALGYPAYVESEAIYDTLTGQVLAAIYGASPVPERLLCTFVLGRSPAGVLARHRACA